MCQSREGLNIRVGISIGAIISEQNAAKYLYHFGVIPPSGDPKSGETIFTSVYYSRKVADVMDDTIRKSVQTFVCNEISIRTLDKANEEAVAIIKSVEDKTRAYMSNLGITLDFIGWADTFTFDPEVQKAINDRYIAQSLESSLPTLQALGNIKVQEGMGKGMSEKGLPVVVTPGMVDALLGVVRQIKVPDAIIPTKK